MVDVNLLVKALKLFGILNIRTTFSNSYHAHIFCLNIFFSSGTSVVNAPKSSSDNTEKEYVDLDLTSKLPEPEPAIKITEVNLANAPNTKKDHDYRPVMFAGCMDLESRKKVCQQYCLNSMISMSFSLWILHRINPPRELTSTDYVCSSVCSPPSCFGAGSP